MADRKMQVERGNLAPYIVVNRDAAVAGVFSVDGERGSVTLDGKYAKVSDLSSSNQEIEKLKPRVTAVESGLKETNLEVESNNTALNKKINNLIVQKTGSSDSQAMSQKATKDYYSSVLFGAGDPSAKDSGIMNPNNTMWWGAHNDYLYAKTSNRTFLKIEKTGNIHATGMLHVIGGADYTSLKLWRKNATSEDGGVLLQTSPWKDDTDGSSAFSIVDQTGQYGTPAINKNSWTFAREGVSRTVATRQWVEGMISYNIANKTTSIKSTADSYLWINGNGNFGHTKGTGTPFWVGNGSVNMQAYSGSSVKLEANSPDQKRRIGLWAYDSPESGSSGKCLIAAYNNGAWSNIQLESSGSGIMAVIGGNTSFDSNGFLKKASPIVDIYRYGNSKTTDEAEGAVVKHLARGVYKISGVLGFNSDGAWGGTEGGIEIPLDSNKQPRVWVDYSVEENGDITIKTFHREYLNSPSFAQNKIEGFSDGDPINIPSDSFVSVRVQMPENSKWNIQQKELQEIHNKELENGKEIISDDQN